MSKRKGVSAEEKRIRVLQLFHEKKDFFQLKELEKIAPKEKGVIVQSVKDVVQSLVDDGLVDTDKIGTSIYYWSYPSKAKQSKKKKLLELDDKCNKLSLKLENSKESLQKAKSGKEDTEERQNFLKTIQELKLKKHCLKEKIKASEGNDPDIIEKLKEDIKKAKEATNRWTDNIFAVKTWCKNKYMIESTVLDKQFGIPPDLDYIE